MAAMDKPDNRESGLIDAKMLQKFQDHFSRANGIYLVCLGTEEGVITRLHGSEEERAYILNLVGENIFMSLVNRLTHSTVENIIEEELPQHNVKIFGVSTRLEGETQIIWCAIAFPVDKDSGEDKIPAYMMRVTEESLYHALEFLEYMSRMLFAVKMDELIAQEAMLQSIEAKESMELELHRSETMTQIVTLLESENGFGKIVDDILELVCNFLGISHGALIRENAEGATLDMICEYGQSEEWCAIAQFQKVDKESVPFFNGKPYMISSDSICPDVFARYFEKHGITAAVYQPIEINDRPIMYLCFEEIGHKRIWDVKDVKFISDAKRIVQSVLAKRIAKNSLASSYASLEAILENVGCGIYVLDPENKKLLYKNHKFEELFAHTISKGKIDQLLFSEKTLREVQFYDEVYFAEEERWMDMHKTQINWVDGRRVLLCMLYDITDKKRYQKKIETQANNDFLTGLYNRMRCEQDLEKFIRIAQSGKSEGALLYLDLDDFKRINDGLGHQYGDVLLKAISHSLQRISGIESSCYRMGGDEFMVIVNDTDKYNLDAICRQIRDIFTKPWYLKGEDYYCTFSMGIVRFPTDGNSVEELIKKADIALAAAKKEGKNRVEYYNGNDEALAHRRLDLEKNMRKATLDACREFEVYYQPLIDVSKAGNHCCGAEALIRWNSEEMGFVSPVDFIPLAEYLGLINPIGDFVLHEAAKRCRYWNEMGHPDYKVNVNLSVVQLLQNDIVKKVRQVIKETGINPKNLTLEVTESLAINDIERMKDILGQMKELGVKIALDDFGTGYSSLNHIRELPIDIIKIDQCFIRHVAEDTFSDAFVKMVAELAAVLHVDICTEGVEYEAQYRVIKGLNIRMIQGFYFNKPMKLEEFEAKYV